jgi:uncharacterized protein HemY
MQENNIGSALKNFNRARMLAQEEHDTLTYIVISINLGDYYTKIADYKNAQKYLEWALENSKKQNAPMFLSETYKSLVSLYKAKKEYKVALGYMEQYKLISDSIVNQNSNREYAELEAKYSIRESEKQNDILIKEQKFTTAQISLQKQYIWILSILVIVSIVFIILFIMQRMKRANALKLLEQQNVEIRKSKKQMEDLNLQYEKLIEKYESH